MKLRKFVTGIVAFAMCASVSSTAVFAEDLIESIPDTSVTEVSMKNYGDSGTLFTDTEGPVHYTIDVDSVNYTVNVKATVADALNDTVFFKSGTSKTTYSLGQVGVSYDMTDANEKAVHIPASNTFSLKAGNVDDFVVSTTDSTSLKSATGGNSVKVIGTSNAENVKELTSKAELYSVVIESALSRKNESDEPNKICVYVGGNTYIYDVESNRISKSEDTAFASVNKNTATGEMYVLNASLNESLLCNCDFACNGEYSSKNKNAYDSSKSAIQVDGINYKFNWYSNGVLDITFYNALADGINKPGKIELPGIGFEKAVKYTTVKGDVTPTVTNVTGKTILANKKPIVTEGLGTAIIPSFSISTTSAIVAKSELDAETATQRQYILGESDNLFHIQIADYDGSPFFIGGDNGIYKMESKASGWKVQQLIPTEFEDFEKYTFNQIPEIMTNASLKNFTPFLLKQQEEPCTIKLNGKEGVLNFKYYVFSNGIVNIGVYSEDFTEEDWKAAEGKTIGTFTILNGMDLSAANGYTFTLTTNFAASAYGSDITETYNFKANNALVTLRANQTAFDDINNTLKTTSIVAKKGYKGEPILISIKPARELNFNNALTVITPDSSADPVFVPTAQHLDTNTLKYDETTNADFIQDEQWGEKYSQVAESFRPVFEEAEQPTSETETTEPTETKQVLYGDVDGSKNVDIIDVICMNKYILGTGVLKNRDAADVDCNGEIDSADSLNILKIALDILTDEDIKDLQNKA